MSYIFNPKGQPRHIIRWRGHIWESPYKILPSWCLFTFVVWTPSLLFNHYLESKLRGDMHLRRLRYAHYALLPIFTVTFITGLFYKIR